MCVYTARSALMLRRVQPHSLRRIQCILIYYCDDDNDNDDGDEEAASNQHDDDDDDCADK